MVVRLIATAICALVVIQLCRLNRQENKPVSKALWLPCFWIFLCSSRNVSEWLHYGGDLQGNRYLEGNPLDRAILSLVMALGVVVLIRRGPQVKKLLQQNLPILLFFFYCALSAVWSDYPDVSLKRWFRAVGDVVMVFIILSEADWVTALQRLLSRIAFLVMPLSILFIRYFPELGRSYSVGGAPSWTGVGTDKNALGMMCLIFGLGSIFFYIQLRREDPVKNRKPLMAYGAVIVMTVYLLWEAHSATALVCFLLGGGAMLATLLSSAARKPAFLHTMVLTALFVPFSAMFLGLGGGMVEGLGRDMTFTGRTAIWHFAPSMVSNPLVGEGYESFWLGKRLLDMERLLNQGINQAHNGYIEIYLNLGYIGIAFLALLLVAGYLRTTRAARLQTDSGSLRLAYFMVAVVYNLSEGGFKMMHPVWIFLLLSIAAVPQSTIPQAPEIRPRLRTGSRKLIKEKELLPVREKVLIAKDRNSVEPSRGTSRHPGHVYVNTGSRKT